MQRFARIISLTTMMSALALSQGSGWKLDKAHSSITFAVAHMAISEVTGQFKDFDIQVSASKDDFSDAAVDATINVASINTNNERRDGHLKSDDFFNAEKFPQITFKSTSIEKVDNKRYKIHGDLTIRDITKKVTFNAVNRGSLKTQRGVLSAWKATISVNRFDYGLKWDRTLEGGDLVAGDEVTITLNLELQKPVS